MPMSIDQPWQHDHSAAVQNGSARGLDRFAHGDDFAIFNVNIASGNIAEVTVHGNDIRIPQH